MTQNIRSVTGVREEISHSDRCPNAALARVQMGTTKTQLCIISGI